MRTIYLDGLFFINFIINYLLLFAVCAVSSLVLHRLRLMLAAAGGALYGVFAFLPRFSFLLSFSMKIISSLLIVYAVFGRKHTFRKLLLFLAVSFVFGGLCFAMTLLFDNFFFEVRGGIYYIHVPFLLLFSSSILSYIICFLYSDIPMR